MNLVPCSSELLEALHALKDEGKIARHLDYLRRLQTTSTSDGRRGLTREKKVVQESPHNAIPNNLGTRLQWLMN